MTHKFISYRNIPTELVSVLRADGHDVFYVASADQNVTEEDVLKKANGEGYIVLTGDEAFAEDIIAQKRVQSGVLLVDKTDVDTANKLLVEHTAELANRYTTIKNKQFKTKSVIATV